jgi:hypothetical protein
MRAPEILKFSIRGFSPKRMAYLLVLVSALLWPLHFRADWRGEEYLGEVAFGLLIATFVLGLLIPRGNKRRLLPLPSLLALLVFIIHSLVSKM